MGLKRKSGRYQVFLVKSEKSIENKEQKNSNPNWVNLLKFWNNF